MLYFTKIVVLTCVLSSFIFPQNLPPVKLDFSSQVLCADGRVLGYIGNRNRIDLRSTGYVSKYVIYSLIATEDRDFYNHDGVSYKGIVRGILKTLTGSTQGGSTLTMQLVKNLFLTNERTISRKITEIELAKKMEGKYSKDQILLMYLNTVYFGRGVYGICAAAQEYYGKSADKLNIPESAALVGLLKNPTGYEPPEHADKMLKRRNEVLHNLLEVGKISEKEFQKFKKIPLNVKLHDHIGKYYIEQVRKEAYNILKPFGKSLNTDEIIIATACDYNTQYAAEKAIKAQWNNFPGSMKQAQIGLFSVENGTGMVRAMVGGNPETDAKGLNRSMQIIRQPGSSFKMFLYGYLLSAGYTLATPLHDTIQIIDSGKVNEWRPMNSENTISGGYLPLETAVQHSINLCAVDAITRLTVPDSIVNFAHKLGIRSAIPPYPSISLGSAEISPAEMASSISVFASEGIYANPLTILKISDKNGYVYYQNQVKSENVLDSATGYLLTTACKTVVDSGTATSIRRFYRGFAAGKTGTTSDYTDAWFVGYNKSLTTAIWVGYDNPQHKLHGGFQYGGTACAPIWGRMMGELSGKIRGFNDEPPTMPVNIESRELCMETGQLADSLCTNRKLFPVNILKLPVTCEKHGIKTETIDTENK
ncbi:MAG: transglycosylase domain-containing protein [Ignavibacteriales bacterium]|nr:transglycosylase domain-containing protein [Ignavibacteriales bacterium]